MLDCLSVETDLFLFSTAAAAADEPDPEGSVEGGGPLAGFFFELLVIEGD